MNSDVISKGEESNSNREYITMFRRFMHDQFGEHYDNYLNGENDIIPEMPSMFEHD